MYYYYSSSTKHCRWCGCPYTAKKPHDKDGFCIPAHKQAHYRAYKKYVTSAAQVQDHPAARRVTHRKGKKKL